MTPLGPSTGTLAIALTQAEIDVAELLLVVLSVGAVLAGAFALSARLAREGAARRERRVLAGVRVGVWVLAGLSSAALVAALAPGGVPLLVLALLLALALASVDALRNAVAGAILAVRRPFRVGDLVVIGDTAGLVRRVGLLTVELETDDQSVIEVPTRRILEVAVRHPRPTTRRGVPVSLIYPLPPAADPRKARQAALAAAILSRYAAPHRAPTVVLLPPDPTTTTWRLHIQGAAFDPAHTAAWQSDVTDLLRDSL
ncbi:MAG: hypothetical protein AMXMBFR64_35680 [Myxococcales bacterium]